MIPLLTLLGCAGERPTTLGANNGQLGLCPDSPNCVSSAESRESHRIEPLDATLPEVRQAVTAMAGAQIISEQGNYLYAEFTTRLMGFVDELLQLRNRKNFLEQKLTQKEAPRDRLKVVQLQGELEQKQK